MNLKPIHSTREFIDQLKKEKELLVINDPVNPDLEIAEIQRRVVAKRGPAILFTNVIGSKFSVATNLYGSARRIHIAFGSRPVDLIRKIAETAQGIMPPTPKKIWEARGLAFEALKVGLKKESSPRVLESSISPVDIMQVPALRS
ncbi:MAG TPA: UbiD family decarboxylase, partial [Leptospiraceae bacterium]|nr:UbiD family decarboxylase [Leptospiraceae bacterium]